MRATIRKWQVPPLYGGGSEDGLLQVLPAPGRVNALPLARVGQREPLVRLVGVKTDYITPRSDRRHNPSQLRRPPQRYLQSQSPTNITTGLPHGVWPANF